MTVLSQNTSDLNSGRAYRALRERYPGWRDVLEADPAELVEVIRAGGLANQKGPRIQAILRELDGSPHGLDLAWLAGLRRAAGAGRADRRCPAWAPRRPAACCCSRWGCR